MNQRNLQQASRSDGVDQIPAGLYIGGQWVIPGTTFGVVNPADGEEFAEVANATTVEALAALDAAAAARESWAAISPRARADLMHAAYALMMERSDIISHIMTLESGKPLTESRAEFKLSADFWLWFAEQTAHVHGTYSESSNGGFRVLVTHQPIGPCLLITPWNFPLLMVVRKAGAALAAGCTVVIKTAQETPLTCAVFVKVLEDAGFPKGVVNLLHTRTSAAISEALMKDRRLRKISFTGSTGVGSTLLRQAADNILSSSMELGGDGPFIVLDDADIDLAAEHAVICKFRNAGQACVAANRIIVDKRIEPAFTKKFVDLTKALVVGNGLEPVDVGPMISSKQRDRVYDLIRNLTAAGGEILTGGRIVQRPGYFFEPTVVRFASRNDVLCDQELFAPVAAIFAVDGADEALAFANDSRFGLASYLFTRNVNRAIKFGERLEFAMVGINRGIMAEPSAPFGGTKASGLGREAGHDGIYEFMEKKYMALTVQ